MQSKLLIILAVLVLPACATMSDPVINTVIQKVEVPITVPCKVLVPPKPDFNFPKLQQSQNIFDKNKSILADRKLHLGYEAELSAALNSCIK